MSIDADFRDVRRAILDRLKSGNWGLRLRRSLAAAAIVGVTGGSSSFDAPPNQPSLYPPVVGGYPEDHGFSLRNLFKVFYDDAAQNRARYIEDKKELEAEMKACTAGPHGCHSPIGEFAAMLEKVRAIPDRLAQAKIVNAWINIRIAYDTNEPLYAKNNDDHRTLSNALKDGKAVCDEIARLKLFALERLNFSPDDIRWVAEDMYVDGRPQQHGHAVMVVRDKGKVWVMNLMPAERPRSLTQPEAMGMIISASKLESSATQLNFSRQSDWSKACYIFLPTFQFNATQAGSYDSAEPLGDWSNVPAQARNAVKETISLNADDFRKMPLMAIMASAFLGHYKITDAKTAKKDNAKRPSLVAPKTPQCVEPPSYIPSASNISPTGLPAPTMRFNAEGINLPLFQTPTL